MSVLFTRGSCLSDGWFPFMTRYKVSFWSAELNGASLSNIFNETKRCEWSLLFQMDYDTRTKVDLYLLFPEGDMTVLHASIPINFPAASLLC